MKTTITVKKVVRFGKTYYYPIDKEAKTFLILTKTSTALTPAMIGLIKSLGYEVIEIES